MPGGRGPRPVAAHDLLEKRLPGIGPDLSSGLKLIGRHDLAVTPLLNGKNHSFGDDHGGVTAAHLLPPEFGRAVNGPVGPNPRRTVDAVALRPAEVGPGKGRSGVRRSSGNFPGSSGAGRCRLRRSFRLGRNR